MKFGCVFTNYNNSRLTAEAVRSLNQGSARPEKIVVVDNDSRADERQLLERLAGEHANVELVLNPSNTGYFRGLNAGIKRIRASHPDLEYLVIGNNDLVFPPDFAQALAGLGSVPASHPVIAPDIVTLDGVHQNPHVINRIGKVRELLYDLYHSSYPMARLMRAVARTSASLTARKDEEQHAVARPIHQGYGACYILTRAFFERFDALWAPTFLMGEEYFLAKQLEDKGLSVYYEPGIVVRHHCHASTAKVPSRELWEHARRAHSLYRRHRRPYQACVNCVMDTSDSRIEFDAAGVCDHCRGFLLHVKPRWMPDERGRAIFAKMAEEIRASARGKDFDCIIGLSGGLDSSYLLHLAVREFGLRPLVFHVDGGWNTDIAVSNIQALVDKLGLDLYTEVINWEEMRDFQLAFFKAGVPHLDIPQDHAFVATLYKFAHQHGIKHILNGGNISTECVRNPTEFLYYGTDMAQLRDIHRKFGTIPLKTYPFSPVLFHKVYLRFLRGVKVVKPLDWLPYSKKLATDTLVAEYGWTPYPQKHFESRFTRFYEGYWLYERFGFDTRRVQFSSLILTGQMTRAQALEELERPPYDPGTIEHEFDFVAKKLGIPSEELRRYFDMPLKSYRDYRNQRWMFNLGARVLQAIGAEKAIKR